MDLLGIGQLLVFNIVQSRFAMRQHFPLGRRPLVLGQFAEIQWRLVNSQDALPERLQCLEPLGHRHNFGIGDGIARAGQQISQANLWPDRAGQDPHCQIKRA